MTLTNSIPIDEVITEVYRVKEEITLTHNNDIDLILKSLRNQQEKMGICSDNPTKVGDLISVLECDLGAA